MNLGHQLGTVVREAVREQPATGFWHQVGQAAIEHVRTVVEQFDPVRHEVWITRDDERTCPICGQLDRLVWPEGDGFVPPLHDNCRCTRTYHHLEFRRRLVEAWQDVAVTRTSWEWVSSF